MVGGKRTGRVSLQWVWPLQWRQLRGWTPCVHVLDAAIEPGARESHLDEEHRGGCGGSGGTMDELIERTDAISIETPTSGMARSPSLDDDYFQDAAESLSVASTPRALSNTSEVVAELADSVETPTTSETELDAAAEAQDQEDLSALAPAPGTLGKQVSNGAAAAAQSHALEERVRNPRAPACTVL